MLIRDYRDTDAQAFHAINAAWIEAMFVLEPHDEEVLRHPRAQILERGGVILVAELPKEGVVGTGALMPDGTGGVELTKMGVTDAAQGHGVGRALLDALLARAATMPGQLYLLTNRRCAAAVHLYERMGFVHDAALLERYRSVYARSDVAMSYTAG